MSSTSAAIQVSQFVTAFSRAWKKLAAYPSGHPEVVTALDVLDRSLAELRGPAGEVALGVTANALVYGTLDITSVGSQKLAQTLYSRGVAVVRLGNETTRQEIEIFLRLLGTAGTVESRRALWEELTAAGVVNINLEPVNYGTVQVTDGVKEKSKETEERSLWDEVLRALLLNQQFSASRSQVLTHIDSADELGRLIAQYAATPDEQAMPLDDEATFGIRLGNRREESFHKFFFQTVGHHIATATGLKRQNSLEQAMQLLRSLPEKLRRPLICTIAEALSADEGSAELLRDFANELPTDEVLDALRYLSSMEKLSSHSLTLLHSLTTIEASQSEVLSKEVLADVIALFGEDDVARFNPEEHDGTLQHLAVEIAVLPPEATTALDKADNRVDPASNTEILRYFDEVLLDVLVDPDATAAPGTTLGRLEQSFLPLLAAEEYGHLQTIIQRLIGISSGRASEEVKRAAHDCLGRIGGVVVEKATNASDEQLVKLRLLIDSLGLYARTSFLENLATESNRSRRRRLLNFIVAQGPAVIPQVILYLNDERWYVVRNMIVLLRALKDQTSLPEMRKLARHPDLRVRMEAIKSLFAMDSNVPQNLLDHLFNDADPKIGQTAVVLAGNSSIKEAVDPLLRIVQPPDYFGANRQLRLKAIHALGEIGEPRALASLQKFFAFSLLPWPPKAEKYAAWESLKGYPTDARKPLLDTGLKSADGHVREICSRIGNT
jgi:HEAT repeat protein